MSHVVTACCEDFREHDLCSWEVYFPKGAVHAEDVVMDQRVVTVRRSLHNQSVAVWAAVEVVDVATSAA